MKHKIYNKQGQLVGRLEDGELTITHIDLKVVMKDHDGEQDLIEFLQGKGFKFG